MSSLQRTIQKRIQKRIKKQKERSERPLHKHFSPPKLYTSFNIFTREGENLVVTSKKPLTIYEAQCHFNALSISGND